MKESSLVRKIIAAIKKRYPHAYVRKLSDRYARGVPDILVVIHCAAFVRGLNARHEWGGVLFIETKTQNGKLSKLQEHELSLVRANGAEAIIARDVDAVLAKLSEMGAV